MAGDLIYVDRDGRLCNFAGEPLGGPTARFRCSGLDYGDILVGYPDDWHPGGVLFVGEHHRPAVGRASRQKAHHRARRYAASGKGAWGRHARSRRTLERLLRKMAWTIGT